ncbi:MAG: hypothetical protein JWN35_3527 [Frankiales bacterium]|jgi:hypothetical protein|nr:hypothetical protein [Frankiales bacterium]
MTEPPPAKGRRASDDPAADRPTERRRYNRRTQPQQPGPPYYEAFDRIATALEGIRSALEDRVITLPEARQARAAAPDPRRE